jgi:CheY-like chemotaxis protein
MSPEIAGHRRILLVDDNPAIHDDFRRILIADEDAEGKGVDAEAARFFGGRPQSLAAPLQFELASAFQGENAIAIAAAARAQALPFALAFVDMRMPPGIDGLTTIVKLWEIDPDLQVVICTAYSDHGWEEIQAALPARDRWLVLKKPFDKIEVLQLAQSLTEKWRLTQSARAELAALEARLRRSERLLSLQTAGLAV